MPEFDIDQIKEHWQEQNIVNQYDENEIQKMLNRKSRNYIKYILWISVAEFLLLSLINLYNIYNDDYADLWNYLKRFGISQTIDLQNSFHFIDTLITLGGILILGIFTTIFYISYKKIKVEESLKGFIIRIIKFRRVVGIYLLINILYIPFTLGCIACFVLRAVGDQHIEFGNVLKIKFLISLGITAFVLMLLFWIYYRVVYGIFMKRLRNKLAQLESMEKEE